MIFLNAHSKQSNDYEILLLQPGAVTNYFILHNLCASLTLSDFSIMWLAVLTGWSSLLLTRLELLSSTQTVIKRKKNIKPNRQVLVITLPLWLWDLANCISCKCPNKKQGTNGHQLQQTTLPSQRGPPHFAGGLFTRKVYARTALEVLSSSAVYYAPFLKIIITHFFSLWLI